jgi:hypothetical protein
MTVQERLGAFGDWSVTLSQETPDEILEALKEYQMGTLYITPSRVDWRKVHPKEVARYAGIYQKREFTDDRRTISGCSLLLLLGNGQGRGSGVDLTPIDLTGESFTDALTAAIADTDIQVGNIVPEIGGLPSGNFLLQDARHKVEEITKQFGAEYKITPKAELDAGSPASLWPTFNAPVVFIKRGAKGVDSDWKPLPIASSAMGEDVINFATQKIIAADQDGVPVIQGQATIASSKRGPNGTLLEITSVSADSQVGQAAANARAAALLALENAPRQTVSLSTDEFDIDGTVVVGDTVSVWNPEVGFFDIDNHIIVQGEHYFPLNLRVFGATWPITEGMGVYLRPPTASGDDNIFDLSPYLVPESGSTDLEVGAAARKLVPSPTESLGPVIAPVVNPDAPPPIPDPPTIRSEERSVLVKQPMTSGGNPMPATVTKFNVYASTTSGFTPGPTNYIGYISVVRADVITLGIPLLKSFKWEEDALTYFRTTAINSGGEGPASIEVAETAGLIPNAAILNLDAEKINAGTINVAIELNAAVINGGEINASDINGSVITGGTVQTALSGQRVALRDSAVDRVSFFTGDASEVGPGDLRSVITGAGATRQAFMLMEAPELTGFTQFAQVTAHSQSADLSLNSQASLRVTDASTIYGRVVVEKDQIFAASHPTFNSGGSLSITNSAAYLAHRANGRRIYLDSTQASFIGGDNAEKFDIRDDQINMFAGLGMNGWTIGFNDAGGIYRLETGNNPVLVGQQVRLLSHDDNVQIRIGGFAGAEADCSDGTGVLAYRVFTADIVDACDSALKTEVGPAPWVLDDILTSEFGMQERKSKPGAPMLGFAADKVPDYVTEELNMETGKGKAKRKMRGSKPNAAAAWALVGIQNLNQRFEERLADLESRIAKVEK